MNGEQELRGWDWSQGRARFISPPRLISSWRGVRRVGVAIPLAALGLVLRQGSALAHTGSLAARRDLWTAWSWEPGVLLGLLLAGWLYLRGVDQLWRRAGVGKGIRVWQVEAYAAGLAAILIALVSPLDALSSDLFSAHMVQHLLLILVAAPLLVLGNPVVPFLWALPQPWRRRLGRWRRAPVLRRTWAVLSEPWIAWSLSVAVLWTWHLPVLFQAALGSQLIHSLEHICLLASAVLFWYVLIEHSGRRRFGYGVSVAFVFAMAFQSSVLGVFMTFSSPWYPAYGATTAAWHLTAAQDQQIAGLLMWIPAGAVYFVAGLGLFVLWIQAADRESQRREARQQARALQRATGSVLARPVAELAAELIDP